MIRSRSASGRLFDSITSLPIRMLFADSAKHGCPSPALARREATRSLTKMRIAPLPGELEPLDESFRRRHHRTNLDRTTNGPRLNDCCRGQSFASTESGSTSPGSTVATEGDQVVVAFVLVSL